MTEKTATGKQGADDFTRRTAACITACVTAIGLHRENGALSGQFPCPQCRGTVTYSVAPNNGHTAGACETKGCVSWRQ